MGEADASREVSRILRAAGEGRSVDLEALLPLIYDQLRALAGRLMADERRGHTLQPTALVHEAYLRLLGRDDPGVGGKARFFGAAAEAMRRILIDHARARGAARRGGGRGGVPLDALDLGVRDDPSEILSVDEAVSRLEEQDGRLGEVVKLRFYAGLEGKEIAEILEVTPRTVERDWVFARAWLERELSGG